MVNHANQIYIERKGKLTLSEKTFSSNQAVLGVIERIVAPIGRRIDESSPLVDARLKDGSRVNAIIPPLALKGPCITIRKFKKDALKIQDLIKYKTVTAQMAEFLEMCVQGAQEHRHLRRHGLRARRRRSTSSAPSSRRTSASSPWRTPPSCSCPRSTGCSWRAARPTWKARAPITIRDLVKNCLRMRPDRIVVGECRSRRDAGHAPGDEHRPRRLAHHAARQHPARRASPGWRRWC